MPQVSSSIQDVESNSQPAIIESTRKATSYLKLLLNNSMLPYAIHFWRAGDYNTSVENHKSPFGLESARRIFFLNTIVPIPIGELSSKIVRGQGSATSFTYVGKDPFFRFKRRTLKVTPPRSTPMVQSPWRRFTEFTDFMGDWDREN